MELNHAIVTAVVGALTGLVAAFFKSSIDDRKEVRSEFWNKRYESYTKICKLTRKLFSQPEFIREP